MVDIHSHVVWGVDDGSPSEDVSIAMLEAAAAAGTTDIVASPHADEKYTYDPALIDSRIASLNAKLDGRIRIHRGCDFHLSFENVQAALTEPQRFSIAGGRYILVEFPDFFGSSAGDNALGKLLERGLVPVITHPERNPTIQASPDKLKPWIEHGCKVQVTAGALLGNFGRTAHRCVHRLIQEAMVHIASSDAHDPVRRHARLDEARRDTAQRYGETFADALFTDNPAKVLRDEEIGLAPRPARSLKSYFFRVFT